MTPPAPYGAVPSERQLRWHELEMYAFLHFTINTFTGKEWGFGDEAPELFNPSSFDADAIVRALKAAGMRGVVLTAKHHDGFCLWPTNTTPHNVSRSPWRHGKGDVVRALADASRRHDLQFGVYLSPWDRNHPAYGRPEYVQLYRDQLRELLRQYGPVFEVWHDGANGGDGYYGGARERRTIDRRTYYDWPTTWKLVRELQPGAVIFSDVGPDVRWVGNEHGTAGEPSWATFQPVGVDGDAPAPGYIREKESPVGHRTAAQWLPAECDVSIRPGWFWHEMETPKVKTPDDLLDLYYRSVGRGCNLLLNVPPDRRGLLDPVDVASMARFGERLHAIFKTNLAAPATLTASNIRGSDASYGPRQLVDDDRYSAWVTDDDVKTPELIVDERGVRAGARVATGGPDVNHWGGFIPRRTSMRPRRLTAVIVLALVSGGTAAADDPGKVRRVATHPEVTAALTVLDSWIEATVRQREQPGLSIGVVYDQELIWSKGYGFADAARKVPATPSTLYRIASISKLFTSTAIMQLRDAGKLRLDDPVKQHLPWFAIRPANAEAPPVTVRHLITHTSGLPREADGVNWSDLTFPDREAMVTRLGGQDPVFPPETEWKYSNLAMSLAGEIVAAASGTPWADYVERHILEPLAMTSSRALPNADTPGLAIGYGRRVPGRTRDVEPFVDVGAENPAGSLASTVEDLAKFVALQLRDGGAGGTQILKRSTLREMHRVQWLRSNWQSGWGLGFSIRRVGDQVRIGHGGSLPGHRTQMEIAPADKLGVIVLTNANDGEPARYLNQAFTLLTEAIRKADGPATPQMTARPEWERYVGRYAWKHDEMHVLLLNGALTMITPEAENPWEGRMILEPVGEHTFRLKAAGLSFGALGEVVTFEVNGSGQVTKVRTPNSYWLPK